MAIDLDDEPHVKIEGAVAGAAPKATFSLCLEVNEERIDENEDTTVSHHVLKFHPMDAANTGPGLWSDDTNTWLFKKAPPPPLSEHEKKMREKRTKKGELDPRDTDRDKDAWKRPWLLTHEDDTTFQHVFEARREGDKRSKIDKLCQVTLTKVQMRALKGDGAAEPERIRLLESKINGPTGDNRELEKIFLRCKEIVSGPGTDVYSKQEKKVKRLRVDERYSVFEFLSLLSESGVKELEQLRSRERVIIDRYRDEIKNHHVDINGVTCSWQAERDAEGNKGYSYFWLEMNPKAGKGAATVRPLRGDWWNVRKDASKRGKDLEDLDADGGGGVFRVNTKVKKEAVIKPKSQLERTMDRLTAKNEEAASKDARIEAEGKRRVVKVKAEGYGDGESFMKQTWREENHGSDCDCDMSDRDMHVRQRRPHAHVHVRTPAPPHPRVHTRMFSLSHSLLFTHTHHTHTHTRTQV